ncbi:MAG TPA: hypothetical protein VKJ00_15360, partial [Thermoanaerobaculia bacterium]|nr:hypothetical protein [Thermoanaerobaculia bacterium]
TRELGQLAKRLGLDLAAKTPGAQTSMAASSAKLPKNEFAEGRHSVSEFLMAELRKSDADVAPAPPQAAAFLATHADDLRTIENELLADDPPRWDFDADTPSYVRQQPIPDTSALIALQRVLLGKSLAEYANGDQSAAERSLEASWKLNQELRCMPDSLCQILARGAASWQLGVIRKISVDASVWRARLSEHDYKGSQLDTELFHSWPSAKKFRAFEDLERESETSGWRRLRDRFLQPYATLVWSQVTEGTRRDLLEIREARVVRDWPEHKPKFYSASDILLSISLPNTHGMFRRVDEYLLDAELTEKVLRAKELRAQNGNRWPLSIPGIEETRVPDARWLYSVSPDGVLTLQLNQQPYKDRGGFQLPLRFTSS